MDAENHQQDNPHRPGKKPLFTWHGACLLVLLAIMLLLFAMPNINRIPGKAKEAEVKQNCHAIQLALEKYAVDHQGTYPLIAMGGDWTDSYTVWQEWVDSIPDLNPDMIENGARREAWMPAEPDVGDLLIMEGYLPSYPTNPFAKTSTKRLLRRIHHYPCPSPCPGTPPFWRIVGGRDGNKMAEVFGPVWLHSGQSIAGDYYVHHMFNDPVYDFEGDVYKEPPGGWTRPSGNEFLTGNFSYYPRLEFNTGWSLDPNPIAIGYILAGYGGPRTAGQDVYNRNGNYKGRQRTESCESDTTANYYPDDIPCLVSDSDQPSPEANNGGPDTIQDGVIIVLTGDCSVK